MDRLTDRFGFGFSNQPALMEDLVGAIEQLAGLDPGLGIAAGSGSWGMSMTSACSLRQLSLATTAGYRKLMMG